MRESERKKLWRKQQPDTMTVVEHLTELRRRLIISVIAVALGAVAGWFLYRPVFNLLTNPFCDFIRLHPELSIQGGGSNTECGLAFNSVVELEADIASYLANYNAKPTPFVWTKSADIILAKVERARATLAAVKTGNQPLESVH